MSSIRAEFGATNPFKLGSCVRSSSSLVRTIDVTSHLSGTVCALPFNGHIIETVGNFVSGNTASEVYVGGIVASAPSFSAGQDLPKGTLAADLTSNPYNALSAPTTWCRYTLSPPFGQQAGGMSITWWAKLPTSAITNGKAFMFVLSSTDGSYVSGSCTTPSTMAIEMGIKSTAGAYDSAIIPGLAAGAWYFCAFVLPTGSSPVARCYVVPAGTNTIGSPNTTFTITGLPGGFTDLVIGKWANATLGGSGGAFPGRLQDFRVFNRPLLDSEVSAIIAKTQPIKISSFYSKFREPAFMLTLNGTTTDVMGNNVVTEMYGNGVASDTLPYTTGLVLPQGGLAANLVNNPFNTTVAPLTWFRYTPSPYLDQVTNGMTITLWLKTPSAALSGDDVAYVFILHHATRKNGDGSYAYLYMSPNQGSTHTLGFGFYNGGGPVSSSYPSITRTGLAFNTWHFVAVVVTPGVNPTGSMYIAPSGNSSVGSASTVLFGSSATMTAFSDVLMGRWGYELYPVYRCAYPGQYQNVRIYSRVLATTELNSLLKGEL